ncbi:hypothetical protein VKS41_004392 [Umbelopsis sp. WA50703]
MVDAIVGPADTTVISDGSSAQVASDKISVDANAQPEILTALKANIEPMSQTKIPKIVHFVYGMKDENPQLDLIQYLSIKSAQETIKPEKIYLHYHYLPTGEWFDLIRPLLTLRQVDIPTKIFGNRVDHYAHRADVVRLEALKEFGGIYLDLDVILMKSIDHLLDEEFAMGQEGIGGWSGLCNAVLLSRANAPFLQRWYETYKHFNQKDWNHHSVLLPRLLAAKFSSEIRQLNYDAFFWPLWDKNGLRQLYLEKSYDFANNLGVHLWESAANKNLIKDITPGVIQEVDTSINCVLRRFLPNQSAVRDGACNIIKDTTASNGLIGNWPISPPPTGNPATNPFRIDEVSGNQLSGLARNAEFKSVPNQDESLLYLNGKDSYIFLPMPTETSMDTVTVSWRMTIPKGYKKRYGTAMMIQSDLLKVYVQTQTTTLDMTHNGVYVLNGIIPNLSENLGLGVRTLQIADYSATDATVRSNLNVDPSPVEVNDGQEHHYALTINIKEGRLIVYQDGYVLMSNAQWRPPVDNTHGKDIVRGVWFGSPEPEESNYQDEWDTKHSLAGWWRRVQVWNRELSPEQITDIAKTSTRPQAPTNTEQQHEPLSASVDTQLGDPIQEDSIENSIVDEVEDEVEDGIEEIDNDLVDMENDWLSE